MSDGPALLVTLGTSPAIVPEAFLLPGVAFRAVHVLTTETPDVGPIQAFFQQHAPNCGLTLTRVAGFRDFTGEPDHFQFEEVLYRWILATRIPPSRRFFCLSGGFKTMSAALQKAAAVLGAAEIFHVLADSGFRDSAERSRPPQTADEILAARDTGQLHWIRLGPEGGWPQLRTATPAAYPLETRSEQDGVRRVAAPDHAFRIRVRELIERAQRITHAWERLPELPFPELATWSAADLTWLNAPVEPASASDRHWVAQLPKVELHCHLGGFATTGDLLAQVRHAAQKPATLPPLAAIALPPDWPLPTQPIGLEAYRRLGDNNGSTLLRDPGCLRRQCELLYAQLLDQNVRYAEIRCSPANYASQPQGRSPWTVLGEIRDAFQSCMQTARQRQASQPPAPAPCHVNLLVIGTRQAAGDYRAGIARHLALALAAAEHWRRDDECRVVGVDLAGYEDVSTRAHYYREEFVGVHRCGLALTVHAGENDDPEAIWRAVFDLNARRLGHALSLVDSPDLLQSVVDRGIGVEMCPYANCQIRGFDLDPTNGTPAPAHPYPLQRYLHHGARVSVNTDNLGISGATLTDNLLLAPRLSPGLARIDLLWLQRHALETAFLPTCRRRDLLQSLAAAVPHPTSVPTTLPPFPP